MYNFTSVYPLSLFICCVCVCKILESFFFFNPLLQARELRLRKAKAGKLPEVPWVVSRMEMGGCLPECNVESPVPVPGIAWTKAGQGKMNRKGQMGKMWEDSSVGWGRERNLDDFLNFWLEQWEIVALAEVGERRRWNTASTRCRAAWSKCHEEPTAHTCFKSEAEHLVEGLREVLSRLCHWKWILG